MAIELINSTPFVPLQFESIDKQLNMFGVIVLRASFDIRNGERLALSSEQRPPVLEDQYFGSPGASSLRRESALAPYKPKTDVMIEATAYSPSGAMEKNWTAGVTVGPLVKTFQVTGPRRWSRKFGLPKLTEPEPIESLPVRYEVAFGGAAADKPDVYCSSNPVGVGFQDPDGDVDDRCPQLLPADLESIEYGRPLDVVGLGPIAPAWQPRLQHAGTADEHWARTRAPYLPLNFSYEFYNAAAPGLTFSGFAAGDEIVTLNNLSRDRRLEFGLPGIEMITLIQFDDGRVIPGPMNLDTIELEVDEAKAFLTWRAIYPAHIPTRRIELRMSAPDYLVEA